MKKISFFWEIVCLLYWCGFFWYYFYGNGALDMLLTATVMFAPFSPFTYVALLGVILHVFLKMSYDSYIK